MSLVATQLSNVLRKDNSHLANVARVARARELQSLLNSPPSAIKLALGQLERHTLAWSPSNAAQALKVVSVYRELGEQGLGPPALSLLVPFDPLPGCSEPHHVTDVWKHPLLGNKVRESMMDITIVSPPALLIVPTKLAPMQARKGIAIFTLGTPSTQVLPMLTQWQDALFQYSSTQSIWVDVPYAYRWQVHGIISCCKLPGVVGLDRPRPSLGSKQQDQWSNIKIHFGPGVGSALMQDVVVGWLRKTLDSHRAVVGLQSTISDAKAKVLEIASPAAAYQCGSLINSCIITSPTAALVTTYAEPDQWGTLMTQTWAVDPTNAAIRLSIRDSDPARNKRLASVQATQEQLRAATDRKGHAPIGPSTDKPETLRVTLEVLVAVESCLGQWLNDLMDRISHESGVPLSRQDAPCGLDLGCWQAVRDFEGGWAGKVVIQCKGPQDIGKIRDLVHCEGIAIEGHTSTLALTSNFLDVCDSL